MLHHDYFRKMLEWLLGLLVASLHHSDCAEEEIVNYWVFAGGGDHRPLHLYRPAQPPVISNTVATRPAYHHHHHKPDQATTITINQAQPSPSQIIVKNKAQQPPSQASVIKKANNPLSLDLDNKSGPAITILWPESQINPDNHNHRPSIINQDQPSPSKADDIINPGQ